MKCCSISMVRSRGSLWHRSYFLIEELSSGRVLDDDRSVRRGTTMANGENRYDDSSETRIMYVEVATLKLILHLTGNQCKSLSVHGMLMQPLWQIKTRGKVLGYMLDRWTFLRRQVGKELSNTTLVKLTGLC